MESLNAFVARHVNENVREDRTLDRDAAFKRARIDPDFGAYEEKLLRMGWMEASTKVMKRISGDLAAVNDPEQREFPFLDDILILNPDGTEVRFTADVNRSQFIKAMEIREKNIKDSELKLQQMRNLFVQLDVSWQHDPEMRFEDVLAAHKMGLMAAAIGGRAR